MKKTRVGILGAGPAGLLLGRMLQAHGIDTVILEQRSRDYVLARLRAGVLEPGTVRMLREYGVNARMDELGIPHQNVKLCWDKTRHSIPMTGDNGQQMITYGQNMIVEDLIKLREADGLPLIFDATAESIEGLPDDPIVHYTHNGERKTLTCDFVAACDGYWGIGRKHIPDAEAHSYLKEFPFSWFGILADAPLNVATQGFCHSTRGLALTSSRGKDISRLYLQVDPDFDPATMTDEQVWDEFDRRLEDQEGNTLVRGPITDKTVARLRAFVCEKMRYGSLALAGDAAHIVPPSGAKGLNLAVGDIRVLGQALIELLKDNDSTLLDRYEQIALERVWPTVHWSCTMSEMFHIFPDQTYFDTQRQYETLEYWSHTDEGQQFFRKSMLGRPIAI